MEALCNAESQVKNWFDEETKKGLVDIKFFLGHISNTTSKASLSKEFVNVISSDSLPNPMGFEDNFPDQLSSEELKDFYTDLVKK